MYQLYSVTKYVPEHSHRGGGLALCESESQRVNLNVLLYTCSHTQMPTAEACTAIHSHDVPRIGARRGERSGPEVVRWSGSGPGPDHFGPLLVQPHFGPLPDHFRTTSNHFRPLQSHTPCSSLIIYHSPLPAHTRMRFHPCTGRQSRIVLSPLPRLIIINRINTLTAQGSAPSVLFSVVRSC